MKSRFIGRLSMALLGWTLLAGCASTPCVGTHTTARGAMHESHPSLVMPGEVLVQMEGRYAAAGALGWEASRNDPPPESDRIADYGSFKVIELRHREHLRTINGRPREYTSSTVRLLERRGGFHPHRRLVR